MQSPKHPEAQQKNNISAPAAAPRHAKTRSRRADRLQSPTNQPRQPVHRFEPQKWPR